MNVPKRPVCPCVKDCRERSADCHAKCGRYLQYEREYAVFMDERKECQRFEQDYSAYELHVIEKIRKARRKK